MDKDYLDILKSTNLRPNKIKIKEFTPSKEKIIMEQKQVLTELFIQSAEIEALPPGKNRDIQILRLGMIAELDASNLYDKLVGIATSKNVKKLLLDISKEEKVHVGEFEALLEEFDPEYEESENEGEKEVEDLLGIKTNED